MRRKKFYNPDPQSWSSEEQEREYDLPEVDDNDEFDCEPEHVDYEEMIEREGIYADNNCGY